MRIEQGKEEKIIFKQLECADDSIWAVDKDNKVFFKEYIMEDLNDHFHTTVFGDEDGFEMYNFPGLRCVKSNETCSCLYFGLDPQRRAPRQRSIAVAGHFIRSQTSLERYFSDVNLA